MAEVRVGPAGEVELETRSSSHHWVIPVADEVLTAQSSIQSAPP